MHQIRRYVGTLVCQYHRCGNWNSLPSIGHFAIGSQFVHPKLISAASIRNNSNTTVSSEIAADQPNNSILNKFRKKFGWGDTSNTRLRVSSYALYESVADNIDYKILFETFDLPNTFNSWFLITELHVWMLLVRAMAEGSERDQNGRFMRNCIVEALWSDVHKRAKELGPHLSSSSIRTQISILSQQFQAALIAYDEAICSDDVLLASILWMRFFERNCNDYEKLELLLKYVRKQTKMLDSLNRKEFTVKPKINWVSIREI